jgi:type IV pilus assembly protein PilC
MAASGTVAKSFAYEAQTSLGHRFKGTLEAATPDEVQARLTELQLKVIEVSLADGPPPKRKGLPADEFMMFNQQLAHLTQAGLPIERGLRLIAIDMRSGRLARAAEDVAAELERGVPLQDAFTRNESRFPALYGKLVEAGVSAGNLPAMLFNLGKHMELVGRLRRSLIRTLAYPAAVLAALSLVLLFISIYVIPQFRDIFADFRTTLPWLTEMMLNMAVIYPWICGIVWSLVILVVAVDIGLRQTQGSGIPWLNLCLHVPIVGKILRANTLARWMDSMRIGIEAGLDLPRAIGLASETVGESRLTRDARDLSALIERGSPLLEYRGTVLPITVAAAIELASTSGDLPTALRSMSSMYAEEAENRLRMLPSILTPMVLMIIGGVVSLNIVAMFLPLVKLIQSVSGGN